MIIYNILWTSSDFIDTLLIFSFEILLTCLIVVALDVGNTKAKVSGPKVQDYMKSLGLLPRGKIQTFMDSEIVRLADPFVPSDTTAIRKSVFINTNFGSGGVTYSIYGNPDGRNTYEDITSTFQDAPKRGSYWMHRMMNQGGREKLLLGIRRLLARR